MKFTGGGKTCWGDGEVYPTDCGAGKKKAENNGVEGYPEQSRVVQAGKQDTPQEKKNPSSRASHWMLMGGGLREGGQDFSQGNHKKGKGRGISEIITCDLWAAERGMVVGGGGVLEPTQPTPNPVVFVLGGDGKGSRSDLAGKRPNLQTS